MTTRAFVPTPAMLEALCIASPYFYRYFLQHQESLCDFLGRFDLSYLLSDSDIAELVALCPRQEQELFVALRKLRYALMVRWVWQDALGVIAVEQLCLQLSCFADACLKIAKETVYQRLVERHGSPWVQKPPKLDELAIVAMGKLGACELNLSSDIDLIFVHLGKGQTDGKRCVFNQSFMTTLAQRVIKLLNDVSEDGFVFRVDMRLRPWGEGSPLVISVAALEKYFDGHGRTWERFAWLKGRVVNCVSEPFLAQIEQARKNFVFRYYVDYSAFSALREMRLLIANQVAQRQDLDNIKLGVGGIRDIEFIAQAFALIYGGKHPALTQKTACLQALDLLSELMILPQKTVKDLKNAYVFLRRLEHAIQAYGDEHTQRLPKGEPFCAIAKTLGFDAQALTEALEFHREAVRKPFEALVAKRTDLPSAPIVCHADDVNQLKLLLNQENRQKLHAFWDSKLIATLTDDAKARLQKAYPVLIHALLKSQSDVNVVLPRLLRLLEAIVKRSIYLVMLSENPKDTMDLLPMLAKSPWISEELANYPVLLDTFLQKHYRHLPNKQELGAILQQMLLGAADFDDEAFLMALRLFKKTQVLAVAASDVLAHHPIMKVSDSLTFIGEVVLEACLRRAVFELSLRHGFAKDSDGVRLSYENMGIAIVGYGKLGGIEMGYASDLDVVFLHRLDEQSETDGNMVISGMKFATRVAQKIIAYLTTQTRDGRAYELDMRLRPSGNAGVMVVSCNAFLNYQEQKAWVWEHQALVRARAICGDPQVLRNFEDIRNQILCQERNSTELKNEVIAMREKMRQQHNHRHFHLKDDMGGLIDIEFMAQFCVLNHAHACPHMALWSDNIRIFETACACGVWSKERCQSLSRAYLLLRQATHNQALKDASFEVEGDWQEVRDGVVAIWEEVFGVWDNA